MDQAQKQALQVTKEAAARVIREEIAAIVSERKK